MEAGQSLEEAKRTLDQEVEKLFMDPRDQRLIGGDTTLRIDWRGSEEEESNHSSSRR